jgi:hypothetical protein
MDHDLTDKSRLEDNSLVPPGRNNSGGRDVLLPWARADPNTPSAAVHRPCPGPARVRHHMSLARKRRCGH